MAQVSRTASKAKFETGDVPTQSDFGDLHDSVTWYDEAGGADFSTEYTTTSPTTPSSGVIPFAKKRTGKTFLASLGISDSVDIMQSHFAFKRIQMLVSQLGSTSLQAIGLPTSVSTVGTLTSRTLSSLNFLASARRLGFVTASTSGATASLRTGGATSMGWWRGNATGLGGFYLVLRFGISQTASGYIFCTGLYSSGAPIATGTDPSSLTNIIFVAKDASDTNFQIMNNDSSGTATKTDTGIVPNTNTVYVMRLFCAPNDTTVYVSLEDMNGTDFFETSLTTNLPSNSTGLTGILHIDNNSTASSVSVEFLDLYVDKNS